MEKHIALPIGSDWLVKTRCQFACFTQEFDTRFDARTEAALIHSLSKAKTGAEALIGFVTRLLVLVKNLRKTNKLYSWHEQNVDYCFRTMTLFFY